MTRGRSLYSAAHDKKNLPSQPKKAKRKKRTAEPEGPRNAAPKISFIPQLTPTETQRERMRQIQLRGQEEETDVRRQYETLDGTNLSEPHVLPPRMDLRRTNHLRDPDLDGDDLDSRTAADDEGLPRIAELSVRDASIIQLDNQLTSVFSQMRTLKSTADALLNRAQQEANTQAIHHSEQILWIIDEALLPWLTEVDDHLDGIIEVTPEGEAVAEDTPQPQGGPEIELSGE